ncbi:DegT/DnrJ/EryC1/StrS family aminotransferase [Candidatus Njordibacter sp. Uisw_039]|uniref:DegT/DnrJ/EryC1/StrS family aminotransferase n=1 Tax=Candidatus Njordibacter sp. Uisw_039 TaxID=3230972 RepID=UPI003D537E9A
MKEYIYVSKPAMPPLEEFLPYLESIWESQILSNGGVFNDRLEKDLCSYLGVEHISLFSSGTTALIAAINSFDLDGEVITTPFSFVATSHAIKWNNLDPVFVDINKDTLNISPEKIEQAITDKTTAILAVHCYGNPCDVEAISHIAQKYKLKVIYDAAHAFGVEDLSGSVLKYGDASVLSFHATKVFSTIEGGAVVCKSLEEKQGLDRFKNFGFSSHSTVDVLGLNGKMSEVNAAFGILQLKYLDEYILKRKNIFDFYMKELSSIESLEFIQYKSGTNFNYSYFPILIGENFPLNCEDLLVYLQQRNVMCRRYFHPLISDFDVYKTVLVSKPNFVNAQKAAEEILCLPIYPDLTKNNVARIVEMIRGLL